MIYVFGLLRPYFQTPLYNQCAWNKRNTGEGLEVWLTGKESLYIYMTLYILCFWMLFFVGCFAELSDDEGDVERLQLLESGSSDVSFRSHDVSL